MDGPKLELNSKPFVDAIKPALEALQDLKAAVQALDNTTVKNLKANVQSAKTQLVSAVSGIEETLTKLPGAIEKSVAGSSAKARASGRKIGKAIGDGAVEETLRTVRSARQRMQNEYEQWFNRGGKVKPEALLNLRAQGVQLFPQDVTRLLDYKKQLKDVKQEGNLQTNLRAGFSNRQDKAQETALRQQEQEVLREMGFLANLRARYLARQTKAQETALRQQEQDVLKESALQANMRARFQASQAKAQQTALRQQEQDVLKESALQTNMRARFQARQAKAQETALRQQEQDVLKESALQTNMRARFQARQAKAQETALRQQEQEVVRESAFLANLRARYKARQLKVQETALRQQEQDVLKESALQANMRAQYQARQAKSQLDAADKNAAFSAMSPRGQLSRATRVAGALDAGMPEVEAMKRYGASAVEASRNLASLQQQVNTLNTAKQGLLERSRDVHSAFRGIAGAAGALFLTYGALVPLTTAFFASTAVKRAVSEFAALEFQLKFVQAASDDYSISVQAMSAEIQKMAVDAGKMPVDAAKGMRLLAQSGLSATESLQALPAVMRTATIGELDMADAATTMTGAMNAFGLQVSDLERIGDVFAKAGSMSNTSVAQISESMKQASSIAQEYKLSIEDVSTVLVALAKRNITGSAAGTAVRNLYGDLAAPRGAGKDVAKALGISLFGKDGKIKDLFSEYIPEIRKALDKLTHESQVLVLNRIANERGGKALSALLGMSDDDLKEVRAQMQKAPGFVRGAVDALNDTLQRDFEKLKSTLSASLIQGGEAGALGIRSAVQELTKLVASPEFIGAVSNLVKLTAALAQGFVWLGQVIMSPAAQFTAVAATAVMMTGAFSAATPSLVSAAGALGITAGAAKVAGTALATLTRSFAWFAGISVAVSLLGVLYDKLSEKTPYDEAVSNLDRIIKRQQDYSRELDNTLRKLREQKGLSVEPLKDRAQLAKDRQNLRAQADEDKRVLDEMLKNPLMKSGWAAQRRKSEASEAAYQSLASRSLNMYLKDQEDAKKAEEIARLSAPRAALVQGTDGENLRTLNLPDGSADAAARKAQSEASKLYQNALRPSQTLKAEFDNANRALDTQAKLDEARLQGTYDKGLISYEDFEEARDKLQKDARDSRVKSLTEEAQETQSEIEKIQAAAQAANAKAPGAVTPEQLESDVSRLRSQIDAGRQEVAQLTSEQTQADIASSTRRAKGIVDATKSAADLLLMSKLDAENQAEASSFRKSLLLMSEVEVVRAQAEREVQEKFLKEELRLRMEIDKYKNSDPAVADKAREQLDKLKGDGPKNLAVQAGERAVQEFRATKIAETAKELKSGLADAFIEGGESGAEMLRNTLQDVFIKKPLKLMLEAVFNPFAEAASAGLSSFLGGVLGLRAAGGPVSAGNRYLVGENGPEVLELGQSGRVYNTNESRQMLTTPQQGGQSLQITVAPQISIDSRSDQGQVQQLVARGVKEGNKQMVEQLKALGVVR